MPAYPREGFYRVSSAAVERLPEAYPEAVRRAQRRAALFAREHRQALKRARSEAREYRHIRIQAKKDGARLLQFVDRLLNRRAA